MGVTLVGHVHLGGTDHHASVTLGEVVEAAGRLGLNQIDLTPHLRDPSDPHRPPKIPFGRPEERWKVASEAVKGDGLKVRFGMEANIVPSYDGDRLFGIHLDIEPNTPLAWPVIASFHFTSRGKLGWPKEHDSETCDQQNPEWMLKGYLKLLEDRVNIIGHPFEYASEMSTPEQVGELARTAKEAGVALEINLRRLLKVAGPSEEVLQQKVWLLRPPYVEVLSQTGVSLYLGTDIHNSNELENLGNIQLVAKYLINQGVHGEKILGWEE